MGVSQAVFLSWGAAVFVLTLVALVDRLDDAKRTVLFLVAMIAWGVWAFWALDVQIVESGVTTRYVYREAWILGLGMALWMLVMFLDRALTYLRRRAGA